MNKRPSSLRARLILSHLLVSLVSIGLLSSYVARTILDSNLQHAEIEQENTARIVSNISEDALIEILTGQRKTVSGESGDLVLEWELLRNSNQVSIPDIKAFINSTLATQDPELRFAVYRYPSGELVMTNLPTPPTTATEENAPEVFQASEPGINSAHALRDNPEGGQTLYTAIPIISSNQNLGVIAISKPYQPLREDTRNSLSLLILGALVIATGMSTIGWFLANSLSEPIQGLTQAAQELAQGDLSVRVIPSGTEEMRRLAETFNNMAARLQTNVTQLRTFVANASHELRTPLTVVKLRAEALQEGALHDPKFAEQFLNDINQEVDRLVRMVNDLLDLSRIEAGMVPTARDEINLAILANEIYETFSIRANREEVELELDIEPDLPPVIGNEDQLRRVLINLVENAIKYNQTGGKVELLLRAGIGEKTVRILVKDSGPGIAPENLSHVFERFYRVEATRPRNGNHRGSGLGLAIAKSIVESHGGKIGVTSQLGRGATFWVELPVAA